MIVNNTGDQRVRAATTDAVKVLGEVMAAWKVAPACMALGHPM